MDDGVGAATSSTFNLTVRPVNDEQSLDTNTGLTLSEGGTDTITNTQLATNDVDNTAAQLVYTVDATPGNGTVYLSGVALNAGDTFTQADIDGGLITYTHDGGETTSDSFDVTVDDGAGTTTSSTFNFTVTPVNDEQSLDTNAGLTLSEGDTATMTNTQLSSSDVDNTAAQLVYTVDAATTNGTVYLSGIALNAGDTFTQADIDGGQISYTHDGGETTSDSFDVTVDDGTGATTSTKFNFTVTPVNDAPQTNPDGYTLDEGATLTITAPGVTSNDTDAENDLLLVNVVTGPAHGTLTVNADGSFTYTHDGSETVSDSFTYQAADGNGGFDMATVSLTINPVNDTSVAVDDSLVVSEDGILHGASVLENDLDAESDALTAELVSGPSHGALTLNPDGTFTFQPEAEFNGSDSFQYRVNDGTDMSATATVHLNVAPVNDIPVGVEDAFRVANVDTLVIDGLGVLLNDADVDGDALSVVLLTAPSSGRLSLRPDGSFTYEPDLLFTGEVKFTYLATDGNATSDPVEVTIEVERFGTTLGIDGDESNNDGEDEQEQESSQLAAGLAPALRVEAKEIDRSVPAAARVLFQGPDELDGVVGQVEFLELPREELQELNFAQHETFKQVCVSVQSGENVAEIPVQVFDTSTLWKQLDGTQEDLENGDFVLKLLAGSSLLVSSGVTAGYVLWMVRGSYLFALLSSSLPTWAMMDPLPVLDGQWRATPLPSAGDSLLEMVGGG